MKTDEHIDPQILDIYGNNPTHCYSTIPYVKNTTKSSAPEDGHKVARNMLSNLQRRNKYNTKWHLVGFLFHIDPVKNINLYHPNTFFALVAIC